jgi:signal peptide peptidase SppA
MIPRNQELVETQLKKDSGWFVTDKIVVIDVDGVMMNKAQDSWMRSGDNPVSTFLEKLDKAAGDEDVKAIVLRINSPGGSVAAADMMYHSLAEFKHKKKVPVVACMMDVAASGGYYLACGSDGIIAQPSCVTGSIGTIMQTFSVAGTMEKIGVEAVAVKSGKMKDIGSPLHDMTDEEKQILQEIIDRFYEQFLTVVFNGPRRWWALKRRKRSFITARWPPSPISTARHRSAGQYRSARLAGIGRHAVPLPLAAGLVAIEN